jgi:MerR family transcriptional regulator, light-induced transcriptional regulator
MVSIAEYSQDPKYTIKVLSERTGVRPVTLRAWERRYDLLDPNRQDNNNYRLYSERDIQIIRWITHRLDEGLSISNAVREYRGLREEGIWPEALPSVMAPQPTQAPRFPTSAYADQLYKALISHNEAEAKRIVDATQSMYDIQTIFLEVFYPCLVEIGEAWVRGEIRIATEHFASAFIRGVLMNLLSAFPIYSTAPTILIGSGPEEFHEIAPLMLAVLLRREGYQVEYLGVDLPVDDLVFYAEDVSPAMIILSANAEESARPLFKMQEKLDALPGKPKLGFGGRYFNQHQEMIKMVGGFFLGAGIDEAISNVHDLLD